MKTTLLTLLLATTGFAGYAQSLPIEVAQITNKNTIELISSIAEFETFEGQKLHLQIFMHANPPGSAKIEESHEISHNLLLVVGEYDLYSNGKLYKVGEFYMPKIKAINEFEGKITIRVQHGLAKNRKEARITVDMDKVTIK